MIDLALRILIESADSRHLGPDELRNSVIIINLTFRELLRLEGYRVVIIESILAR
jgi:hypothetical protein